MDCPRGGQTFGVIISGLVCIRIAIMLFFMTVPKLQSLSLLLSSFTSELMVKGGKHRNCTACGKSGHTVRTCSSKAAQTIRKLKSLLPMKVMKQRRQNKPRQGPRTGKYKKQARAKYTKHPLPERRKAAPQHFNIQWCGMKSSTALRLVATDK